MYMWRHTEIQGPSLIRSSVYAHGLASIETLNETPALQPLLHVAEKFSCILSSRKQEAAYSLKVLHNSAFCLVKVEVVCGRLQLWLANI